MNPWKIVMVTAVLAAIVSFAVSGVIHLLCLLIRRFSKAAPASAKTPIGISQTEPEHGAEIAIAIAAAKACLSHGK